MGTFSDYKSAREKQERFQDQIFKLDEMRKEMSEKDFESEGLLEELEDASARLDLASMETMEINRQSGFFSKYVTQPISDVLIDQIDVTDKGDRISQLRTQLFVGNLGVAIATGGKSTIGVGIALTDILASSYLDVERKKFDGQEVDGDDYTKALIFNAVAFGGSYGLTKLGKHLLKNGGRAFSSMVKNTKGKEKILSPMIIDQMSEATKGGAVVLNDFATSEIVEEVNSIANRKYLSANPSTLTILGESEKVLDDIFSEGYGGKVSLVTHGYTSNGGRDPFDVSNSLLKDKDFTKRTIKFNKYDTYHERKIIKRAKRDHVSKTTAKKEMRTEAITQVHDSLPRTYRLLDLAYKEKDGALGLTKNSYAITEQAYKMSRLAHKGFEAEKSEFLMKLEVHTLGEYTSIPQVLDTAKERGINVQLAMDNPDVVEDKNLKEAFQLFGNYHNSTRGYNQEIAFTLKDNKDLLDELTRNGFLKKHMVEVDFDSEGIATGYGIDLSTFDGIDDLETYISDLVDSNTTFSPVKKIANQLATERKVVKRNLLKYIERVKNFKNGGINRVDALIDKRFLNKNLTLAISTEDELQGGREFLGKVNEEFREQFARSSRIIAKNSNGYDPLDIGKKKASVIYINKKEVDLRKDTIVGLANKFGASHEQIADFTRTKIKQELGRSLADQSGFTDLRRNFSYLTKMYGLEDTDLKLVVKKKLKGAYGMYQPSKKTITIQDTGDKYGMLATLRHEVEHAIDMTKRGGYHVGIYNPSPHYRKASSPSQTIAEYWNLNYNQHFLNYEKEMFEMAEEVRLAVKTGYIKDIGGKLEKTITKGQVRKFDFTNEQDLITAHERLYDLVVGSTQGQGHKVSMKTIARVMFDSPEAFKETLFELGGGGKVYRDGLIKDWRKNSWLREYGLSKKQLKGALRRKTFQENYGNNKFPLSRDGFQYSQDNVWKIADLVFKRVDDIQDPIDAYLERMATYKYFRIAHDMLGTTILGGRGSNEGFTSKGLLGFADWVNGKPFTKTVGQMTADIPHQLADSLKIRGSGFTNALDSRVKFFTGWNIDRMKVLSKTRDFLDVTKGEIKDLSLSRSVMRELEDYGEDKSKFGKRFADMYSKDIETLEHGDLIMDIESKLKVTKHMEGILGIEPSDLGVLDPRYTKVQKAMLSASGSRTKEEIEDFIRKLYKVEDAEGNLQLWELHGQENLAINSALEEGYGLSNILDRGRYGTKFSTESRGILYLMKTLLSIGSETINRVIGDFDKGFYTPSSNKEIIKKALGLLGISSINAIGMLSVPFVNHLRKYITDEEEAIQELNDLDAEKVFKDFMATLKGNAPVSIYMTSMGGSAIPSMGRSLKLGNLQNTTAKLVLSKSFVDVLVNYTVTGEYLFGKNKYKKDSDVNKYMDNYFSSGQLERDLEKNIPHMLEFKDRMVALRKEHLSIVRIVHAEPNKEYFDLENPYTLSLQYQEEEKNNENK